MDPNSSFDSLLADLDEAIALLQRAGEEHWQSWLRRGRDQVAHGDARGLDHLLPACGGMGSFNDLVLNQANAGQRSEGFRQADDRLYDLRQSIWQSCHVLSNGQPN